MSLKHIAIIMDGNGRWAKKRHLPRLLGHRAGVKAVERTVRAAADFGIPYLSLYAFSTENWKRPKTEVKGLMSLFRYYINKKVQELVKEDVRLRFAGRTKELPKDIQEIIHEAENETEKGQRLQLIVCLNYGGRQEIVDAVQKLLKDGYKGKVTEETIRSYLYLPDLPDPDLIIRTSGEYRLSNFWLWEGSYSEFYFSSLLWPDFNKEALQEAILSYEKRDRRYGGIQR
ncbi:MULTISPECIES: isoprenyl transferase [Aminobacterium]|jgi:undecaprenyl diphosphate synthase|uniref:Isoprenyl transferase n=1 Tax=Aminobacterium colombiense (strain DSM 12261 / ALA-1) TaxID=572547 RepID=D5EEM4_AMICL|nr:MULTISPECIES: isoprenyl transferase [Aminobacterium]ADE57006.1 undecaprenyl diphosphate synthase [Aminobacterium colombiense DSM 12261]MDD2379965.1 isoprenyl transferase [Aminobacterium colombiense]MDD4266327.1 isoprenyl transferase [Aminobacterium colombiense]NLK29613.1 isoprenyl transferase [Aminobacterium colombiense]